MGNEEIIVIKQMCFISECQLTYNKEQHCTPETAGSLDLPQRVLLGRVTGTHTCQGQGFTVCFYKHQRVTLRIALLRYDFYATESIHLKSTGSRTFSIFGHASTHEVSLKTFLSPQRQCLL